MKRKELLEIPVPQVSFSRFNKKDYESKHGRHCPPYFVAARIVPGEFGDVDSEVVTKADGTVITNPALKYRSDKSSGILCVWLFSEKKKHVYTVYACADSCEWRVWDCIGKRWLTSMLCNLTGYCAYREYQYIYTDKASERLGHYFGSSDPDTLRALDDFQRDNRTYRTKISLLKSRRNIDALMATVPPLPGGISRYIDNHVLKGCRYLWYQRDGKYLVGLCTHCGKTCRTDQFPKGRLIGTKWRCPECGSVVEIKSIKGSASVRNDSCFSVLQNVPGGVMLTEYSVSRWNDRPSDVLNAGKKPLYEDIYHAIGRAHIKFSGHTDYYVYEVRHNSLCSNAPEWYVCGERNTRYAYYNVAPYIKAMLFPGNINSVLRDTPWKYSGLAEFARSDKTVNVSRYLNLVRGMPPLEKLSKLGLHNLACSVNEHAHSSETSDIIGIKWQSTLPLDKLMGINKAELRMFREIDITEQELKLYRKLKENGKSITKKEICELRGLNFNLSSLYGERNHHVYITEYVTVHKIVQYIKKQLAGEYRGTSITNNILLDWNDYIIECLRLGYDLSVSSVVMPKNLNTAHARTAALVKHEENNEHNKKIKKRCKALADMYAMDRDGYVVRMATSADELVYEGKVQHICVGGYAGRYADGECTILFLRKSEHPDEPFVTIEVNESPDGVREVQIRSKRNGTPDDATMKWWKNYKKDVLSKLGGKPYAAEHIEETEMSACAG